MEKGKIATWTILLLIFGTFCIKSVLLLDQDFGWHLRIGQVILQQGFPKTDPFSYTMPSYPYVDHEWLTNVLIAKLYAIIGWYGLSVLFSLFALGALCLQIAFPIKKWSLLPLLATSVTLLSYIGVKPQVLSWLLFSILMSIIRNGKGFFLPFLFLLWSNVHGSFALGIVILFLANLLKITEQRKLLIHDLLIFVVCLLATCITPYGPRVWWEVWMSISDSSLRFSIQEWLPIFFVSHYVIWIYIPFSLLLVWRYKKYFSFLEVTLYGFLFLLGILSDRHLPFWLLFALSMTTKSIYALFEQIKRSKQAVMRFTTSYVIFFLCSLCISGVDVYTTYYKAGRLNETFYYPKQAVAFLRQHPTNGQIFSEYDWGGYLIWKLPEEKIFVDGRMPSWRWKALSHHESDDAFKEFQNVLAEKVAFKTLAAKYKIDTVLISSERVKHHVNKLEALMSQVFHTTSTNQLDFPKQLAQAGMVMIYRDSTAVIYRKK